jgi:hypothetical protein
MLQSQAVGPHTERANWMCRLCFPRRRGKNIVADMVEQLK